jgi:hypothetical protein
LIKIINISQPLKHMHLSKFIQRQACLPVRAFAARHRNDDQLGNSFSFPKHREMFT